MSRWVDRNRMRNALGAVVLGAVALGVSAGAVPAAAEDDPVSAAEEAYQKALNAALKIEDGLVRAVDRVREHSVSVVNLQERGGQIRPAGVGSGVLVTSGSKLWVVTNVHVIDRAAQIDVITHDGRKHPVEVQDNVERYDISLLRFKEKVRGYKGVTIKASVSEDKSRLREGTWVIATGNPFHLAMDGSPVTTLGVVSGTDRFLGGRFQYAGAIQHDAEVNPGNSGGPLWNLKGQLVGINGKIAMGMRLPGEGPSNTGASFSLPIHQVAKYLKQLTSDDDVMAGYLGLVTETAKDKRGKAVGAKITKIERRSPITADRSKKKPLVGDIVTRISAGGRSKRIYSTNDLIGTMSELSAGTKVTLTCKRGRSSVKWTGILGARR